MIGLETREFLSTRVAQVAGQLRAFETLLLTTQLARYGVAMSRILAGSAYVGILLTNFPVRQLLFGAASDWIGPVRDHDQLAPWVGLFEGLPAPVFTAVYLGVIGLGLAFVLGWHTRLSGALFLLGCVQILEMNPLVSDQGDNILRIGIFLILLTDCGGVWSLDAARAARRAWEGSAGRWQPLRQISAHPIAVTTRTLMHNGAVITLAVQIITIYIAAAMFKIPGVGWRQGTAISYPLRSDSYQVWPVLNHLVTSSGIVVWLVTYGAIFLQLYFPALLLNRVTRRIALVAIIGLHLGIAVLMGLPWFTLAMVAFDGIFVSAATYQALERGVVPRWNRLRAEVGRRLLRGSR